MVMHGSRARALQRRWVSQTAGSFLIAFVLAACVQVNDLTYGITLRNECSSSVVVAVAAEPDDVINDDLMDNRRFSLGRGEETSLAVDTQPTEVFIVVFEPDLRVRSVVPVTTTTNPDDSKFVLEGDLCSAT